MAATNEAVAEGVCPWGFLAGLREDNEAPKSQTGEVPEVVIRGQGEELTAEIHVEQGESNKEQGVSQQSFADKVRSNQPECIDVEALPEPIMNGEVPMVRLPKKGPREEKRLL